MVDALMYLSEINSEWTDDQSECRYFQSSKALDKIINSLLEYKNNGVGENIITKGYFYQICACSVVNLISVSRILIDYEYPLSTPEELTSDVKKNKYIKLIKK